jgi:hypothetical protein
LCERLSAALATLGQKYSMWLHQVAMLCKLDAARLQEGFLRPRGRIVALAVRRLDVEHRSEGKPPYLLRGLSEIRKKLRLKYNTASDRASALSRISGCRELGES